ncbi:hypothetical protein BC831DRAFT_452551 [Entophlyctis helioformis]|nr:hypothetical protein BC831DRAFT_452551 [Entophlyctis helioformis]
MAAQPHAATARTHNFVHNDAIWRQTIWYELNTAKNWEAHWGFMRDTMIDDEDQGDAKLPPLKEDLQKRAGHGGAVGDAKAAGGNKRKVKAHTQVAVVMDPKRSGLPAKVPPGLTFSRVAAAAEAAGAATSKTPSGPTSSVPTAPQQGGARQPPASPPTGKPPTDDTIVSNWLYTYNVPRIIKYRFPSEKYTMPPTTSNDIGWPWERVQKQMQMPFALQSSPERFESFEDTQKREAWDQQRQRDKAAMLAHKQQLQQQRSMAPKPVAAGTAGAAESPGPLPMVPTPPAHAMIGKRKGPQVPRVVKQPAEAEMDMDDLDDEILGNAGAGRMGLEGPEITQRRERVPAPYTLERFGKHARGRGDVLKWFGPRESLP